MMPPFRPLAENFPPATEFDWRLLAGRSRGASVDALRSLSIDGLTIGPIHAAGDGPVLGMRAAGAAWTCMQRIDRSDGTLHGEVAEALRGGATGVEFVFTSSPASRGRGIDPDIDPVTLVSDTTVPLRIDAGEATPRLALNALPGRGEVIAAYDPIATMAVRGGGRHPLEDSAASIAALIEAMDQAGRGTAFIADGRPWSDGGASEVQELALVLASAVANLRRLGETGVDPRRAVARLGVALSADADQFLTIAKFRAVRLLFARLFEVAGLPGPRPRVHAETAWRMLTLREPVMNMVRSTTAAFAAAAGGADSITVLPPFLDGGAFSDRMARNTQTILGEEAAVYRAGDPGAGSGAIEALTNELAAAAWRQFTQIEADGGLVAALEGGSIQRAITAMRDARLDRVARRAIAIIGVNVNIDRTAPIPAPLPPMETESLDATLEPIRLSEPFEALCAQSIMRDGGRQRVLLVDLRRAGGEDLSSVADAFAAGGFTVDVAGDEKTEAVRAFVRSGARIACILAGTDGSEEATAAARALRSAGARFLVAAGPFATGAPEAPFDATLSADTDVVALLSDILDRIAEPDENGQS